MSAARLDRKFQKKQGTGFVTLVKQFEVVGCYYFSLPIKEKSTTCSINFNVYAFLFRYLKNTHVKRLLILKVKNINLDNFLKKTFWYRCF